MALNRIQSTNNKKMATTLVSRLFRQSIQTFGRSRFLPIKKEKDSAFDSNVKSLEGVIHQMKCKDINLNLDKLDPKFWTKESKVAFYCMDVYLDKLLTMKVYILKPGTKIPLHDHPNMHGFIKILDGKVRIASYSETQLKVMTTTAANNKRLKTKDANKPEDSKNKEANQQLYVTKMTETVFDPKSRVSILTPRKGNYHEIECMDKPAAFFDLLAPPYNAERIMNFYQLESINKSNVFKLNLIKKPTTLIFDELPYMGPSLT